MHYILALITTFVATFFLMTESMTILKEKNDTLYIINFWQLLGSLWMYVPAFMLIYHQ